MRKFCISILKGILKITFLAYLDLISICLHNFLYINPIVDEKLAVFEKLCDWVEGEAECYTVKELHLKMMEQSGSEDVYAVYAYSYKWLKKKLIEKYKDHIFFAEIQGKSDVVCLKDIASLIVNNNWYMNREKDMAKESERIIITAAKLVLSDIRTQEFPSDLYPSEKEIADIDKCESYLPDTLKRFLGILIKR